MGSKKSLAIGGNLGCWCLPLNSLIPGAPGCPPRGLTTADPVPPCAATRPRLRPSSAPASRVEEGTKIILPVWGRPSDDISPVTLCSNSAARIPGPRRAAAGSGLRARSSARRRRSPERPAQLGPPGLGGPRAAATRRALPALGHLHPSAPPRPQLAPRGARGVAITTGRPPRRPPGRK